MRKLFALIVLASSVAIASAHGPVKPAKPATCPACHMVLSKTKTAETPIAVRLKKGGPIMYCCAGCKSKMPASMIVKSKHM